MARPACDRAAIRPATTPHSFSIQMATTSKLCFEGNRFGAEPVLIMMLAASARLRRTLQLRRGILLGGELGLACVR